MLIFYSSYVYLLSCIIQHVLLFTEGRVYGVKYLIFQQLLSPQKPKGIVGNWLKLLEADYIGRHHDHYCHLPSHCSVLKLLRGAILEITGHCFPLFASLLLSTWSESFWTSTGCTDQDQVTAVCLQTDFWVYLNWLHPLLLLPGPHLSQESHLALPSLPMGPSHSRLVLSVVLWWEEQPRGLRVDFILLKIHFFLFELG